MRYCRWKVLLIASAACAATVAGQQNQAAGHEGVQQQSQRNMAPAQRAQSTREFLGLGAVPDKVAAARGKPLFARNCAFCHGQQGRGATAPSLITSDLVLADDHGEHLAPFLRSGRPEKGMPAFTTMPDTDLKDIAEFLHLEVENVANRGAYHVLNIVVGDAAKGKAYVESHCVQCHSGDTFAHIASRYRSPEQLQRNWIWPSEKAALTATVTTSSGSITGRLIQISDFHITLANATGQILKFDRGSGVEVHVQDPLAAHQDMLMSLANEDMHNITAYLETQK